MRTIHTHDTNDCNKGIEIVTDEPDPNNGNASHHYVMYWREGGDDTGCGDTFRCELDFQHGPIKEVGNNGVTHEALLAILIDRLRGFQRGQFSCRENAIALTKLEEAAMWLDKRTQGRVARGVEGTHEK